MRFIGLGAAASAALLAPGSADAATGGAVVDPRCITVRDVVIVGGAEAWADKKLCKSPGSARYDVIEVAQTIYGAASTQAAFEKATSPQLRELRDQIEVLRAQVAGVGGDATDARVALLAAQTRFISELARQDRGFAEAIMQFRNSVVDIAATAEGAAALAQYNAGDEIGALAILDRLRAANDVARQTQSNLASAAEARRIARLALDARRKGKVTTAAVIARYEQVTVLDPGVFDDWKELSRLLDHAGRLPDAARAIANASKVAQSEQERSLALSDLGNILLTQGDRFGAAKAFNEALVIDRKRAAADPSDAEARRALAISNEKIGDVLVEQGEVAEASKLYAADLMIVRELAAANPSDPRAQRDLMVALHRFGDTCIGLGDFAGASKAYAEALAIARKLAAADPGNVQGERDVAMGLLESGYVRIDQNDLAEAENAFAEFLALARRHVTADPKNAQHKRDLLVGLVALGNVQLAKGKLEEAFQAYSESSSISRALATADPSNARAARDYWDGLLRIGDIRLAQGNLADAEKAYAAGLSLSRHASSADPTNGDALDDLAYSLQKLGDVFTASGKLAGARHAYGESLAILRKLTASGNAPSYQEADLGDTLAGMAKLPRSGVSWRDVVAHYEAMDAKGMLTPADRSKLDAARREAAAAAPH